MICPTCRTENPPEARFCMACASPLEARVPREARKTVTVVFADVVGSTPLGERLDPEALRRVMATYFERVKAVVERHGGTVEKFIGDAVMAVFGLPTLHEDDALRAVRAAMEMRSTLSDLNRELERERGVAISVRTGINTGEVVAGDGTGGTLATGDAINTAARLQQSAEADEILIGAPTYRLVRDAVTADPVEALELKGKASPVPAFRLVDVVVDAEAVTRHLDSPMVGRRKEQELFRLAFDRAIEERTCHLATVLGSAGVGKSRLVEEFLRQVDATVLRGRCLPYGEGITFWPVIEVVRQAAGITEADDPAAARAKLKAICSTGERGELVFERVSQVLGLATDSAVPEETFWAIRRLLEILAGDRPVVVVFEDIHWGEPTFLDLVEHVADWTHDAPLLMVCLSRGELLDARPGWGGGKANATTIQLEPLNQEESAILIDNLIGQAELAPAVRDRIVEAAEGNPLFVEQLLSMMIDDELLRRDDGHLIPVGDLDRLTVPPTIQALLAARLDRLGHEERAVIERASVVGRIFYRGAVTQLSPEEMRSRVGGYLRTLVRRELIRQHSSEFDEDTYGFRHILIRDTTYEAMPKGTRAELHERFADWMESRAGERLREYEEIVGYHLEEAHRYRLELGPLDDRARGLSQRAGKLLGAAGLRAVSRGDVRGSINLLSRAARLLPEADPDRIRLLPDLGEAFLNGAELAAAGTVIDEALQWAARIGDSRSHVRARIVKIFHGVTTNPAVGFADALAEAEDILREVEAMGDEDLLVQAQEVVAALRFWSGRSGDAMDLLEVAIARAKAGGANQAQLTRLYRALTGPTVFGSVPAEAGLEMWNRVVTEVSGVAEAYAREALAALHAMRGEFEQARIDHDRSEALLRELGGMLDLATDQVPALIEMRAGDPVAAEARLRPALEMLTEVGETGFLSTSAAELAEALYAQGKDEDAEAYSRMSEENAAADDIASQLQWRAVRAKVLARRGEIGEAEELARAAVALAEQTDYFSMHGDALMALAEVLRLDGRTEQAATLLEQAAGLYERKDDVVSVSRARRMAREIRGTR